MRAKLAAVLFLVACAPPGGEGVSAPEAGAGADPFAGQRLFVTDQGIRVEDDPYTRRVARLADIDVFTTLLAPDVALVVEPAEGAPARVSNLLGGALVRRFAGDLDKTQALGAAKVFLIQPVLAEDAARFDGVLVVDWRLRSETAEEIGAVYASRRLSGAVRTSPWDAFTADDAEFIALQSAAQILETDAVRRALTAARDIALLENAPTPVLRAQPETAEPPPAGSATTQRPAPRPAPLAATPKPVLRSADFAQAAGEDEFELPLTERTLTGE